MGAFWKFVLMEGAGKVDKFIEQKEKHYVSNAFMLMESQEEITLQRYITCLLQCNKFSFSMREISPMVFHLYP